MYACSPVVLEDRGWTLARISRCRPFSIPYMTTSSFPPSSTAAYCRQLYATSGHSFVHCAWRSSVAQHAMVWHAYAAPGTADDGFSSRGGFLPPTLPPCLYLNSWLFPTDGKNMPLSLSIDMVHLRGVSFHILFAQQSDGGEADQIVVCRLCLAFWCHISSALSTCAMLPTLVPAV